MAMQPCKKCLENSWTYKNLDTGWVRATCKSCLNEVEWEPKQKNTKERCCGKFTVLVEPRITEKKKRKAYYFSKYLYCTKCRKIYYDEQYKVINNI
jgi:hypothetical protein